MTLALARDLLDDPAAGGEASLEEPDLTSFRRPPKILPKPHQISPSVPNFTSQNNFYFTMKSEF